MVRHGLMSEIIKDIQDRKPIRVIYDGEDYGEYIWKNERYEGVIGYLTLDQLKKVLKKEIDFIEIRRI